MSKNKTNNIPFTKKSKKVGFSDPVHNNTSYSSILDNQIVIEGTKKIYELKYKAQELSPLKHRNKICSRYPVPEKLPQLIENTENKLHYHNVVSCGDVWACPTCFLKIMQGRREEVEQIISTLQSEGYHFYFLTFTISHNRQSKLKPLYNDLQKAFTKVFEGRKGIKLRHAFGSDFYTIRILETTYGNNGFHPHYHFIIASKSKKTHAVNILQIYAAYCRNLRQLGYKPSARGIDYKRVNDVAGASDNLSEYFAKELTQLLTKEKRTKFSTVSIFAVLNSQEFNEAEKAVIWKEYLKSIKYKRQFRISKALALKCRQPEQSDEELAQKTESIEKIIYEFALHEWSYLSREKLHAYVINAYREHGIEAIETIMSLAPELSKRGTYKTIQQKKRKPLKVKRLAIAEFDPKLLRMNELFPKQYENTNSNKAKRRERYRSMWD